MFDHSADHYKSSLDMAYEKRSYQRREQQHDPRHPREEVFSDEG